MSHTNAKISITAGDDRTIRVGIVKKSDKSPSSITGDSLKFTVKKKASDTITLIALSTVQAAEMLILASPDDHKVDIFLVPVNTLALAANSPYVFDVQLTKAGSSKVHTVLKGVFEVEPGVTA